MRSKFRNNEIQKWTWNTRSYENAGKFLWGKKKSDLADSGGLECSEGSGGSAADEERSDGEGLEGHEARIPGVPSQEGWDSPADLCGATEAPPPVTSASSSAIAGPATVFISCNDNLWRHHKPHSPHFIRSSLLKLRMMKIGPEIQWASRLWAATSRMGPYDFCGPFRFVLPRANIVSADITTLLVRISLSHHLRC